VESVQSKQEVAWPGLKHMCLYFGLLSTRKSHALKFNLYLKYTTVKLLNIAHAFCPLQNLFININWTSDKRCLFSASKYLKIDALKIST